MTNAIARPLLLRHVARHMSRGIILLLFAGALYAQSPLLIVNDPNITIAPGQVATFLVPGAPAKLPLLAINGTDAIEASTVPVPTMLAGFSAIIDTEPDGTLTPLPIFRLRQEVICSPIPSQLSRQCIRTLLTVQIPPDVRTPNFPVGPAILTAIYVSVDGNRFLNIYPSVDPLKVHILTACDTVTGGHPTDSSPCNPLITHADGMLVGPFSGPSVMPAKPGETLILYAWGLGPTNPVVPVGIASPSPPAVALGQFTVIVDFGCGIQAVAPAFVGLTPGQVGLYQVNFKVPKPPVACKTFPGGALPMNLTLLSDGWISSDTALPYIALPATGVN